MNNSRWLLLIMVKWLPTITKVKLVNRSIYWQDSHLKQDKLCHSLITMRLVKIVAIWQIQWLSDIVPLSLFHTDVNNEVAILRVCHTNTVQTHTLNTIKVRCKYYTSTVKILYKYHANSEEKILCEQYYICRYYTYIYHTKRGGNSVSLWYDASITMTHGHF